MTAELAEMVPMIPVKSVPVGLKCDAQDCKRIAPTGGFCEPHKRALALTTALQDKFLFFLNTGNRESALRPGRGNDNDIVDAGELFAAALTLLIRSVFGKNVYFDESPIYADMIGSDDSSPHWRVDFAWSLEEDDDDDD